MIPETRPYYDHATHTHYVTLPREVFDAFAAGIGMLALPLFADSVKEGEWVWIECEDDELLLEITDIAAVCHVAEQPA